MLLCTVDGRRLPVLAHNRHITLEIGVSSLALRIQRHRTSSRLTLHLCNLPRQLPRQYPEYDVYWLRTTDFHLRKFPCILPARYMPSHWHVYLTPLAQRSFLTVGAVCLFSCFELSLMSNKDSREDFDVSSR